MWVEFVAGSLLCSGKFSLGILVFPSPQKPTFPNSNSILESTDTSERVLVNSFVLYAWVSKLHIDIFFIYFICP